jgi:hypothetical protein
MVVTPSTFAELVGRGESHSYRESFST